MDMEINKLKQSLLLADERIEQLSTLINASPDFILFKDGVGHWLDANKAILELFGLGGFDYRGKTDAELASHAHPVFREALLTCKTTDEAAWQEKVTSRVEEVIPQPNGGEVVADVYKVPLFNPDGTRKGLVILGRDITELKHAEEAFKSSEQRYRDLVEEGFDGISVQKSSRIVLANRRLHHMLGYSEGELVGMEHWRVYHPDYQDMVQKQAQARLRGETPPSRYGVKAQRKDGSSFEAEISAKTVALDGEPGIQVWLRDVSEQKRAQKTLRESEARFKALSEESPLGISLIDGDGRYQYVNPAFVKIFGYTLDEIKTGKDWFKMAFPDETYRKEVVRIWREDLINFPLGESCPRIFNVRCKDGSDKTIMFRPVTIEPLSHFLLHEDITERLRAEEALRQSEERYRLLADNITDVIWLLDLNSMSYTYFSPSVRRQSGFTPEEAMSHSVEEALTPDSLKMAMNTLSTEIARDGQEGVDPGRTPTLELEINCKDGSTKWGEVTINFIRNTEGRPISILGVTRDISERRQVKEHLRRSEENYRLMLESSPDPMVLYGLEGKVVMLNPAFTRIFGWTNEELAGKNIDYVPDEDWPRTKEMLGLMKRGQSTGGFDTRRYDKQGHLLDISLSWSVWRDREGLPAGSVVTLRNVTEQRRLENQLRQAQKMEALGTLAGGIAHDFNNILSAIMGYTELANYLSSKGESNDEQLDQVLKGVERARNLIKQILTFSRKSGATPRPLSLNQSVQETMKLLEASLPKMIDIELHLDPDLHMVDADPNQMEQVILNLATNASDAMPEGGRLIIETKNNTLDDVYCQQHLGLQPGRYVMLMVSDTGQGITPDIAAHIFEPFFTTKDVGKGTGLGLATVYGIIKGHGGHVNCYSEPDQGTTFKIYLPVYQSDESQDIGPQAAVSEEMLRGSETILLVDDEPALRELGASALEDMGYLVLTAASGEEALKTYAAQTERIDLVMMDLGMPGMGGHKCLKNILAINPEAKVVIASGYLSNGHVQASLKAGAAGYVGKPFKRVELLAMIRNVLDAD